MDKYLAHKSSGCGCTPSCELICVSEGGCYSSLHPGGFLAERPWEKKMKKEKPSSLWIWDNYFSKIIAAPIQEGATRFNCGCAIYRLIRTFNFIFYTTELIP